MRYSVSDTAEYGDLTRGARDRRTRPRTDEGAPRRHPVGRVREGVDCRDGRRRTAPDRAARAGIGAAARAGGSRAPRLDAPRRDGGRLASREVGVGLLGYGTVGAAVNRLLVENADDIERATGHRLRVVRALVRDAAKDRGFDPHGCPDDRVRRASRRSRDRRGRGGDGRNRAGRHPGPRVARSSQARRHGQQAARRATRRGAVRGGSDSRGSAPLRGERAPRSRSSRCSARRSSSRTSTASSGSSTGTTNFILTEMEGGATFHESLAEARRRGFAEADPTDDLSGADAAAKMAILATIAFGSRVALDDVEYQGLEELPPGLRPPRASSRWSCDSSARQR